MKNIKLLVLTAMSALTLVGCNGGKTGTLPSGGKKVDVTTEEGQATLKEKLSGVQKAYTALTFDSASLTSTTSDVNLSAKLNAEAESLGKITLDANLKDFGAKAEAKVAKHAKGEGEEYDSVDASLSAKTTSGSLSVKGSLPGQKEGETAELDASVSLKGLDASAYLSGSKIYGDISASSNDKLVTDIDAFGNTLLGQLKESMFGALLPYVLPDGIPEELFNKAELKLTLAEFYSKNVTDKKVFIDMGKPVEWPAIEQQEEAQQEADGLDEFVAQIAELAKQNIGFEFKTYSNSTFGFAFAMSKESLVNLAKANSETEEEGNKNAEQIEKFVSKFTFNADVYFNKNFLLESAGLSFNADVKLDKSILGDGAETFTTFDGTVSAKATEKVELKYGGVKVEFPSFEDYKELKLF